MNTEARGRAVLAEAIPDRQADARRYEGPAMAYKAHPLPGLLKERQPLSWLVEGWIETGALAVLVGPESSFKSFLAIDWSLSIATGRDWQGCRVKPGRVLFIAGEGRTGVIRRMRGWASFYKTVPEDLLLGGEPIKLLGSDDAERIGKLGHFDLVVIDTLARNFGPGNGNDQKDMSAAIAHADRIRKATGATVLLVHHAPLEGREEGKLRPRGSSALAGAADAIFTCQFDKESKVIMVSSIKQKDAPNPDTRYLTFEVVALAEQDNFSNEITTVVLRETHKRPAQKKTLGKHQKRLIQELRSRANGKPDLEIAIRDVTSSMELSRQSRLRLEQWFSQQGWTRPSVDGRHVVELEAMPCI